jgi:hypothetical protein
VPSEANTPDSMCSDQNRAAAAARGGTVSSPGGVCAGEWCPMKTVISPRLVDPCSCRCRGTFSFRVRVPGVFASLGTPGYPPLAAVAAGVAHASMNRLFGTSVRCPATSIGRYDESALRDFDRLLCDENGHFVTAIGRFATMNGHFVTSIGCSATKIVTLRLRSVALRR